MRIKQLYIDGLEHHVSFLESKAELKALCRYVERAKDDLSHYEGTEDLRSAYETMREDVFPVVKKASSAVWTATKFLSKEGYNLASKAVNSSSLQIKKLSDNNKYFIKEVISQLPEESEFEIQMTSLGAITTDGKVGDFVRDIDEYKSIVNAMNKHSEAVLDYLNTIIMTVSKVSKSSTNKDVMSLLEKLDSLTYPKLALEGHLLPGGRSITFSDKDGVVKYSMLTDKPSATSETVRYSKDEVKSILNKLNELNESLLLIKKGQEQFISTMKVWNEKLPKVMTALVENDIMSNGTKTELKSSLHVSPAVISFYGEIYPELGACVNSYVITLSGNFAKII